MYISCRRNSTDMIVPDKTNDSLQVSGKWKQKESDCTGKRGNVRNFVHSETITTKKMSQNKASKHSTGELTSEYNLFPPNQECQ